MSNEIAKSETHAVAKIKHYLCHPNVVAQMERILPKYLTPERMWSVMLAAVNRDPKLQKCSGESLIEAMMKCSAWGLEPIGEHGVWLIPYGDQVQAIRDYRGEMDLALRCGPDLSSFDIPRVVYDTDEFHAEYGDDPMIRHVPTALGQKRGALIGCYAIARLKNGTRKGVVLSQEDVERHRQASRAKDAADGPWRKHTQSMWLKSAIKELCKWLPRMAPYASLPDDDFEQSTVEVPMVSVKYDDSEPKRGVASIKERLAANRQLQTAGPPPTDDAPAPAADPEPVATEREPGAD